MTTIYQAHCDGYTSGLLESVNDLQAWWDDIKSKANLKGKKLKIYKGQGSAACAVFSPVPFREMIV